MKKLIWVVGVFLIFFGCATPKMIKHERLAIKIIMNSDPPGAKIYDKYGVMVGTAPYTFTRAWIRQTWDDGDVIYWENEKRSKIGARGEFTGIASKDGYRRTIIEIPYEFKGKSETIERTIFLRKEGE